MSLLLSDLKSSTSNALRFLRNNYDNPIAIVAKAMSLYPITYLFPDRLYLTIMYRALTGKPLNLKNPARFNEKTQWLKLYDRKEWYTNIADKVEVRDYVASRIGEQFLIPILAVYNSVEDINFNELPNQFVLKCTHDSGTTVVCQDKSKLDIEASKRYLRKRMKKNYYYLHREYCYKNIKPRIVCEKFMSVDGESTPTDYKFFCFNGVPKLIQVDTDRFVDHGRLTMDPDWKPAPFHIDRKYLLPDLNAKKLVDKPENLEEMLEISTKLSQDFKFIRVDLYSINNKVYFGELTFYQGSGYDPIYPDEYDFWLGNQLDLNK